MSKITFFVVSILAVFGMIALSLVAPVFADELVSHAPADAKVYIVTPQDGDTVPESFTVKFGLSKMEIAPAGENKDNTGHHHLLIDLAELPDLESSLPANDNIRHFGKGQTETELTLSPGKHSLQLLLGNYAHVPHDNPVISDKIEVIVR